MKTAGLFGLVFYVVFWIYLVVSWFINAYQFFMLDFEPSYKDEIIKGIGIIIPPLNCVTVWF